MKNLVPITHYTPKYVNRAHWKTALSALKQQEDLDSFLDQYEEGLNIGLDDIPSPVQSKRNPRMDTQSNVKMAESIIKWYDKGYIMGPFHPKDEFVQDCRINPIFPVPKPDGTVRPVVNYSKEIGGSSLNELLHPEWCTVEYIKLQEIKNNHLIFLPIPKTILLSAFNKYMFQKVSKTNLTLSTHACHTGTSGIGLLAAERCMQS